MDFVTWINTAVGAIGIIVGIIGWKSLSAATKIKNRIKADTVQQAQIIHNGLDDYAVIRLSRETTKEELERIILEMQPVTKNEISEIQEKSNERITQLETKVDSIPNVYVGKDPPAESKDGDIWFQVE